MYSSETFNYKHVWLQHQWNNNGGKCGECGDPWDQPVGERPNQAGGTYATGTIVDTYNEGQV